LPRPRARGSLSATRRTRASDLIVLGAHRRQILRDVFVGTTIERVTRTARRPVLIANGKTGERWKKVFIAIDMSETSAEAARTAHALGLLDGADVSFVHAYAPITRQMMTYAGIPLERVQEESAREFQATRREVARFIQALGLQDLNYNARIVEGLGAGAIAGVVEQGKADLLVIGTRGLSGVKRLFLGSVAQDLMSSLKTDILAVPPAG
jgi:nucleotide-binding universal stress UspA family protein